MKEKKEDLDKVGKSEKETSKKVLIADDDNEARAFLKYVLSREDYDVVEVKDGKSLVEAAPKEKPDIIISDIVMPGLSGWRATKKIRELPSLKNTPIIYYSSLLKDFELYDILKPAGPSAFVFKPFQAKEMLGIIKKLLEEK
ncbi:response regulator [Elusimicrobiota bacterium]